MFENFFGHGFFGAHNVQMVRKDVWMQQLYLLNFYAKKFL